ncbi:hypothetical protein Droror1_Dr00006616 [Drosera rotundifolia]
MGAACCVASRDSTTQPGPANDYPRRQSPSWSFPWDNRGRVAGEETSLGWISDGVGRNNGLDRKSSTGVSAHASDGGSSLGTSVAGSWSKSPMNETTIRNLKTSSSGKSVSSKLSVEVKLASVSPQVSCPGSVKSSPLAHSTPSASAHPISPSETHLHSPGYELPQGKSDSHCSGRNSPNPSSLSGEMPAPHSLPPGSNESSTRASVGRSSDGWSLLAFSELVSSSRRDRSSIGSEPCSPTPDKMTRSSGKKSRSPSFDWQSCGVCSKLLPEKSPWSSQKIIAGNELCVVAVLICGHVYHADCLEYITPDINKYDPACPVCTFGEKAVQRLAGKVLKAEKDSRARSRKKSKIRVVGTDESVEFDYWKSDEHDEERSPNKKMVSSSSLRSNSGKLFLRRHFSFGSTGSNPKRKGLFSVKSSKQ